MPPTFSSASACLSRTEKGEYGRNKSNIPSCTDNRHHPIHQIHLFLLASTLKSTTPGPSEPTPAYNSPAQYSSCPTPCTRGAPLSWRCTPAGNHSRRRMPGRSACVSSRAVSNMKERRTVTLDMQVVVAIEVSDGNEQSPLIQVLIPGEPARSARRKEGVSL